MKDDDMQDQWTDRLSEYIDGDLGPDERLELEQHLEGCASCRETLAAVRLVVDQAGAVGDVAPAHDLWPAIATAIAPARAPRHVSLSVPQLAAAGLFVALVSGLSTLAIVGRDAEREPRTAEVSPAARQRPASLADASTTRAAAELVAALSAGRDALSPKTVATLERSLATIDRAIFEAQSALEHDPNNPYLTGHLARERRLKLAVLRQIHSLAEVNQ